jgi:hypothetical protein
VLEYALELCDEAGEDSVGVLHRESIVEMLREGAAVEHMAHCAEMDKLARSDSDELPV